MSKQLGDCYGYANNKAREFDQSGRYDTLRVVHGRITHPIFDNEIHHAWVVCGNMVYHEVGNQEMSQSRVHFNRTFDPVVDNSYTVEEALKNALRHGHHGPWPKAKKNPGPTNRPITASRRLVSDVWQLLPSTGPQLVQSLATKWSKNSVYRALRELIDLNYVYLDAGVEHSVYRKSEALKKRASNPLKNPSDATGSWDIGPPFVVYAFAPRTDGLHSSGRNSKIYGFNPGFRFLYFNPSESDPEFNTPKTALGQPIKSVWFEQPDAAFNFADKIADMDRLIVVTQISAKPVLWVLPFAEKWSEEIKIAAHLGDSRHFEWLLDYLDDNYGGEVAEIYQQFGEDHFRKYDNYVTDWY